MKIIAVLTLWMSCCMAFSQSRSLEFSQAKLVTTVETVPNQKVWKVTGIYTNQTSFGNHSATESPAILINGVRNFYLVPTPRGSGFFSYPATGFPIWLPAGTTLAVSNKVTYINVLEFNIVP